MANAPLPSIAGSNDIKYIIKKLLDLEERLGGTQKQATGAKLDEFEANCRRITENIYSIRSKQNELVKKKDKKGFRQVDLTRLKIEINDGMRATHELLDSLKRILKSQKNNPKIPEFEKTSKAQLVAKLESLYQDMRDELEGKEVRDQTVDYDRKDAADKKLLFGNTPTRGDDFRYQADQLHEDEEKQLQRWREMDQEMDNRLDDVIVLLDQINVQAVEQGDKMKQINELTKATDKEITKVNATLEVQNGRLKELVKKYRAPSRFCLDFVIFIFILGLVGIIINMIR